MHKENSEKQSRKREPPGPAVTIGSNKVQSENPDAIQREKISLDLYHIRFHGVSVLYIIGWHPDNNRGRSVYAITKIATRMLAHSRNVS